MTFAVRNCLLAMTPIRQGKANVTNIPFFIVELFEDLDPHIGDSHGETVVKANASKGEW